AEIRIERGKPGSAGARDALRSRDRFAFALHRVADRYTFNAEAYLFQVCIRHTDHDVSAGVEMRISAPCFRAAAFTATVVLLPLPDASFAQRVREQNSDQERTRATPAMRLGLLEGLGEAQACMDEEDFACARERLDRLASTRGLTGYETAQIFMAYGALYIAEERYPEAITAFEQMLSQEDLPLALEQSTLYTIAQ